MRVEARKKTMETLRRHVRASEQRGLRRQMKEAGLEDDDVRAAGTAGQEPKGSVSPSSTMKRAIPEGYDYDPRALKPLARMLWALGISLGHAMTAHREFTRLKSATISPDGLIGGRGYVMSVKEVRGALHDACEAISAVSDTIHDELHAPHWRPKLGELEREDIEGVERLVGDAERVLEDPEEEASVEEGLDHAEEEGEQAQLEEGEVAGGSEVPDGEDMPDSESARVKTASRLESMFERISRRFANSSIPVETMSGGPRVQHMDRADTDQTGPFGSYNSEEPQSTDDGWSRDDGVGNEYLYQSEWENALPSKSAESLVPGRNTDTTPTEGWDFGIGYGDGDDAHGQGAGGYGAKDSDGKGVYGPSSKMPSDPAGKLHDDESDTTPAVEMAVGRGNRTARRGGSNLPNDGEPPVGRSDYYRGDKGSNPVNVVPSNVGSSKMPGQAIPAKATPSTARPRHHREHMFGTSEMPSETDASYDHSIDVQPGTGYRSERNQPYVKWDHTTRNMRPDPLHQRDEDGPYVKQEG